MLKYNIHAPEKHILGNLWLCKSQQVWRLQLPVHGNYHGCQVLWTRANKHLPVWSAIGALTCSPPLVVVEVCVCVCVIRKNEPNFVALLLWLKLYISHKLHVSGPGKLNLSYTSQTRLMLVECLFILISFENNMFNMNAAISSLSALRIGAQNGIKRCRNKHIWWFGRGRICLTKSCETMFHVLLNWMI